MKKLLIMALAAFIGITANPEMLGASDSVTLKGLNEAGIVKTVPLDSVVSKLPEEILPNIDEMFSAADSEYYPSYEEEYYYDDYSWEPDIAYVDEGYGSAGFYISVSIHSDTIVVQPSYYDIYKTGKLVYGHNTSDLLGGLHYLSEGDVITVNEDGVARNYLISQISLYEKTADGYLEGDKYLMGRIKNKAMGHDIAFMTCAGVSYGNGDASHRLVVYADAL